MRSDLVCINTIFKRVKSCKSLMSLFLSMMAIGMLPFLFSCSSDDIEDLVTKGDDSTIHSAFSLHDDDTMERIIPSSSTGSSWNGGYVSILFPLTQSVGVVPCLSMEGKRVGFNAAKPDLNENGKAIKHLQDYYGWEVMAHSMTAPYVKESYFVDSLNTDLAKQILREGSYDNGATSMKTTAVLDLSTMRNYMVDKSLTQWVELPKEWIRPYLKDYNTKKVRKYNPTFPIDYQWGELKRLASQYGIVLNAAVMPANTGSHANISAVRGYFDHVFEVVSDIPEYNTVPLTTCVHRISLESTSETSTNNLYNERTLKKWKDLVDKAADKHAWIIFFMHSYRQCWRNCIEEELVSNGGTYPDEWVMPITEDDDIFSALSSPPARLGIKSWSEWYPCPGTRLRMVYDLLLYLKEKGLDNLTSTQGFSRFGNIVNDGLYTKGGQIGQDKYWIEGSQKVYNYHVVGVDGTELRYER